jgi:hypothetical protein
VGESRAFHLLFSWKFPQYTRRVWWEPNITKKNWLDQGGGSHSEVLDVFCAIEISVKWGKDSISSTLSLVIHRVRFKKKKDLQKTTLASIQGRVGWNSENHQFWWFLSFTLSFFFPERLHCFYIGFHCSYLYRYYNSSRTLCIKCLRFSISYWVSAFHTEI